MVSLVRVLVGMLIVSTLLSATLGLWVYNSHIAPLKALGSKPSIGDILDKLELLEYTMGFDNVTWRVVVEVNPGSRSGSIKVYDLEGGLIEEYRFNYTRTLLLGLTRLEGSGNLTFLNPLDYLEAFSTNIKFNQTQEGTITGVKPFPGIAPVYALSYIGNATYIDWSSFYKPRGQPPQWVSVAFTKVNLEGRSLRGVEVLITQQYTVLSTTLKWYSVEVHARVAELNSVPVASELTLVVPKPDGDTLVVTMKVEKVKLRG